MTALRRIAIVIAAAAMIPAPLGAFASHGGSFNDSSSTWRASPDFLGRGTASASATADHESGAVRVFAHADEDAPAGVDPVPIGVTPDGEDVTTVGLGSSSAQSRAAIVSFLSTPSCDRCLVAAAWTLTKAGVAAAARDGSPPGFHEGRGSLGLRLTVRPQYCGETFECFEVAITAVPSGPGSYLLSAPIAPVPAGTTLIATALISSEAFAKGEAHVTVEGEGFVTGITIG